MEGIIERIVEKCIQSELIEESQRDWMAYSLQRKDKWTSYANNIFLLYHLFIL